MLLRTVVPEAKRHVTAEVIIDMALLAHVTWFCLVQGLESKEAINQPAKNTHTQPRLKYVTLFIN
jgi:hypothetical protein